MATPRTTQPPGWLLRLTYSCPPPPEADTLTIQADPQPGLLDSAGSERPSAVWWLGDLCASTGWRSWQERRGPRLRCTRVLEACAPPEPPRAPPHPWLVRPVGRDDCARPRRPDVHRLRRRTVHEPTRDLPTEARGRRANRNLRTRRHRPPGALEIHLRAPSPLTVRGSHPRPIAISATTAPQTMTGEAR